MTIHARQFTTSASSQPWWYAALNWLSAPLPTGRLDAAAWIRKGIEDIGQEPAPDVREAFEVLVDSMQAESNLGRLGHTAARLDHLRKLHEHLKSQAWLQSNEPQAPQDMPDPVYVLGWMRSGTTALHRLLASDPDNWWPHHFETMFPTPPRQGPDDRGDQTMGVLGELWRISPHYEAIHPMQSQNPEECVNLFTHAFRTPQFSVQYHVPRYLQWLDAQDPAIAYRRYAQELGILRALRGGGERMVLKDPTHMGFLPALTDLFPRARFVFIHRDPVEVFSSMSSMYAYTRAIFSRSVDPSTIGPELFDEPLLQAHADGLAFCDGLEPGRVAHVRHVDLRADPVGEARRIYETLGLPWHAHTEAGLRAHAERPRERHKHEHSPPAFGLDPAAMRERLRDYVQRFDL